MTTVWTADRVEQLCDLYREGLSSSQSARVLGVSRNAVIGKVDRLVDAGVLVRRTIVGRFKPGPSMPKHARKFNPAYTEKAPPTLPEPEVLEPFLIDGKPVTIRTCNDRTCRWPMSEASADMVMCGRPPKKGSHYCDDHFSASYQPQQNQVSRQRQAERTAEAAA